MSSLLDIKCRLLRESDDRHVYAAQKEVRRMMRFVRMRQIRHESGDNAANGKEIGYENDDEIFQNEANP